MRTSDMGIP